MRQTETTPFRGISQEYSGVVYALHAASRLRVLTMRQVEIAWRIGDGHTDKRIATDLGIRQQTVGHHVQCIAQRLHVDRAKHTRAEIVRAVMQAVLELED